MVSLTDLKRSWLLRQLGLTSSTLSESDLLTLLYTQQTAGVASNLPKTAGKWYGNRGFGTVAASIITPGTVIYKPIEIGQVTTITDLGLNSTIVGSGGNVLNMGIYDTFNGRPKNLLRKFTAAITTAATGPITAALSTPLILVPGLYWIGVLNITGTSATYTTSNSEQSELVSGDTITAVMTAACFSTAAQAVLPVDAQSLTLTPLNFAVRAFYKVAA